ncbi:MAG TPA: hypothetical protein VHB27_05975 [Rhodopila sp.]|uniref:hypothetical protein n=1 Tax=Rhodopila sp. TaxID=2480087 RepID=UPI002C4414F8|nr:hypothetical protein [Rhodopila sp.]HVY14753.1 hypothetical protein [Rhodopila sp.]
MLTDAHLDWIHRFTGLNPRDDPGNAPTLSAVPDAGSDQQAQAFKAQFAPLLAAIDGDLGYTADHAEAEAHKTHVTQRETIVRSYGETLRSIDPADETKAKPAIAKTIAGAQAARADIGKFRAGAEKAFNDWQSREANCEDVAAKIGEMEDWGHPKAPSLKAPITAVAADVEARRFAPACTDFDKLLPQFNPVYDDYTRQKAAQAQYEPARAALDPRLAATQASTFHTLERQAAAFPPAQSEMDAAATAKDFVKALLCEQDLDIKVTDYETALAKLQEQKKAFDDTLAGIQDKVDASAERPPPFSKMEPLQDDLEAVRKQMQADADAEDFEAALRDAQDLGGKADLVKQLREELEAKKKAFEDADQAIEPRIVKMGQAQHPSLVPAQTDIANQKQELDTAAGQQDYDAAMKIVDALTVSLNQFDQALADLEAKKQAYEEKAKPIEDLVGSIAQSKHPKLKDEEQDLADQCQRMTDAAAQEDYTAAGAAADALQQSCNEYKQKVDEIARLKDEFDQSWPGDLKTRVDNMMQTRTDDLAALQQPILALVDEIQKTPETEEYEQGLSNIDALKKALDEYDNADETHIFTITFNGKTYSGTQKQLIAAKLEVTNALVNQHMPNLKNLADLHQGHYDALRQVNNASNPVVFVMGAIVRAVGGADLDAVGPLIDAQFKAISAVEQAINGNPAAAGDAYRDAVIALNTAGQAIDHYLSKLEGGAEATSFVAEAIAVLAFALLAAMAAPAIGAATGAGAVTANVAGGAAAAAFETAVREGLGPLSVGYKVDGKDFAVKVAVSTGLGALAGLVGEASMRKAVQETVLKEAVKGLDQAAAEKMLDEAFKKEVIAAIDSGIVAVAGTIATNTPGFFDTKNPMTFEKLAWLIAINFVEGALAPSIARGRKLHWGQNSPTL